MGRKKISSKKSNSVENVKQVQLPATHSLRMSPVSPFRMSLPPMPHDFIDTTLQPRSYGMHVAGPLPQPNPSNTVYPTSVFRDMSPGRGMFFPGTPRPVSPAPTYRTTEVSPSINITWRGQSLFRPPVTTDVVNGFMQPRAESIVPHMMMPPASVPSMSRASFEPRPSIPTNIVNSFLQPRSDGIVSPMMQPRSDGMVPPMVQPRSNGMAPPMMQPRSNGMVPPMQARSNGMVPLIMMPPPSVPNISKASLTPHSSVPNTRFAVPVTGNFSPGASIPVPSATAAKQPSSVLYEVLQGSTLIKQSNDGASFTINSLPVELLMKIFGYITQNELGQNARVCKRWNELKKHSILWKKVNVRFYGHNGHRGSQTEVALKFVFTLPTNVTNIRLDFVFLTGWTETLNFRELCQMLEERCPDLEILILKGANFSLSLLVIIDLCNNYLQNLKSLTLRSAEFPAYYRTTKKCRAISKIEELNLYACHLEKITELPFSRIPDLKKLVLTNTNAEDKWFKSNTVFFKKLEVLHFSFAPVGPRAFRMIQNNGLYLKELFMCGTDLCDKNLKFENSVFPELKTICLTYCPGLTAEGVVFITQSCQALENVYVEEKIAKSCEEHSYFLVNRCKLEIVKAMSCVNHYPKSFYT